MPGSNGRAGNELPTPVLDLSQASVIREIQGVFKHVVAGFKNETGLKPAWDQKTEKGFSDWLETNVIGFQGEKHLLFHQEGQRRYPTSRGAIVIYRHGLVFFRRKTEDEPDKKAMEAFPILGAFERDTDGIGGGEVVPPKLVS